MTESAVPPRKPHGILWEGSSALDGAPIVAIVTSGSSNAKTGPMAQVWILRADVSPLDAVRTGADRSICGACPLRNPREGLRDRACYVQVPQAPQSVWRAYRAGRYPPVTPDAFARQAIRWGAYGDPALLPQELVRACNAAARFWTGYTHQHARAWAQWARGAFMASVETPAQEARTRARGWGTFRVGRRDGSDRGEATLCENVATGASCVECKACDGGPHAIYIPAHGPQAQAVPVERLRRRKGAA